MRSEPPVLQTSDLTKRFGGHVAVNNVTTCFNPGVLTAIVGPNGAGKTTFFNLISGQLRATTGEVMLFGDDISDMPASERARKGIGRAFQLTNLFPNLSVQENVRLTIQSREGIGLNLFTMARSHAGLIEQAEQYLNQVHLADKADEVASTLSHGDQRKLEVAMLLAMEPRIFMFDEPTAGMTLDEVPVILELIEGIKNKLDKLVLLVEHKMEVVRSLADRIMVLHNGYLVADGEPAEVMASPIVQEAYLGMGVADHV